MSTTKLSRLAAKLERDTLIEKLVWTAKPVTSELMPERPSHILCVYEASYDDVRLRVFEETMSSLLGSKATLQFLDDKGGIEWECNNINGIDNLIETIKFKLNRISKKIDAILAA